MNRSRIASKSQSSNKKKAPNQAQQKHLKGQQGIQKGAERDLMRDPERLRQEEIGLEDEPTIEEIDESQLLTDEVDEYEEANREPADTNQEQDSFEWMPPVETANAMVIEPAASYWLEVSEVGGKMRCTFRQPDWRQSGSSLEESARLKVTALLTTLTAWLEVCGSDFLRQPTPANYAHLQGIYSDEIKEESIITKQGLLLTLYRWLKQQPDKTWSGVLADLLGGKQPSVSAEDKNRQTELRYTLEKSWLIWPQQQAFPLAILLDDVEYANAWVMVALQRYDSYKKGDTDWMGVLEERSPDAKHEHLVKMIKNTKTNLDGFKQYLLQKRREEDGI